MDDRLLTIRLAEYDHAREVAYHNDKIIYEVASIVWAANAVLLGFAFEVRPTPNANLEAMSVAVIGIALSVFVMVVVRLLKKPQHIAFETCQRIEDEIPSSSRLHQRIARKYPKGAAQVWFRIITVLFVSIWLSVFVQSAHFLWRLRSNF